MVQKINLEKINEVFDVFDSSELKVITYVRLDYEMFQYSALNCPSFNTSYVKINDFENHKQVVWFMPIGEIFKNDLFDDFLNKKNILIEILFVKVKVNETEIFNLPYFKKFKVKRVETISYLVSRIIEESRLNKNKPGNKQLELHLYKSLLTYTLREQHELNPKIIAQLSEDFYDERLFNILAFLNARFHEDLTLERIGNIVGLSTEYVSQFFKRKTGLSLSNYIVDLKMIKAVQILIRNNESITAISLECGFTDLPYFNRRFKAAFKMNPTVAKQKFHLMFVSSGATEFLANMKSLN